MTFFDNLPRLFGKKSQVLNLHCLIHVPDDVCSNDYTLNDISAFSFENELGFVRKQLQTANKPVAQFYRRIHELNSIKKK